VVPKITKLTTP